MSQNAFVFFIKILDKGKLGNDKFVRFGLWCGTGHYAALLTCNPNKYEAEIRNFKGSGLLNNFTFSG